MEDSKMLNLELPHQDMFYFIYFQYTNNEKLITYLSFKQIKITMQNAKISTCQTQESKAKT